MTSLTSLEQRVMQMLLAGNDVALACLRHQAEQVQISSRNITGVGFLTRFHIPDVERLPGCPSFRLGDVNGTAINVKNRVGFVLHVVKGVLSTLEGYTYDEPWPDEVIGLTLWYSGEQDRDLENIRKIIAAGTPGDPPSRFL